jgi:hypothetical protein
VQKKYETSLASSNVRKPVQAALLAKPLSDYQRAEAIMRRDAGETLAAVAKSYGVSIALSPT